MKRHQLTCPSCAARFVVSISQDTKGVACPKCDRQFKLKRQSSKSASPPAATHDETATAAVQPPSADDELLDDFGEYDDAFDELASFTESLSFESADDSSAPQLPPKVTGKSSKKKKPKANADRPRSRTASDRPRRNLDELTAGTYDKKQYFSEAGARYIKSLLATIGIIVVMVVIAGFLRDQFREAGLVEQSDDARDVRSKGDVLMAAYDYYTGNAAQPVLPKAGPTLEEVIEAFMQRANVPPMPPDTEPQPEWRVWEEPQDEQWSLPADQGASFEEVVALSKSWRLSPVGMSGQMVEIQSPGDGSPPILFDLRTKNGRQLDGARLPAPWSSGEHGRLQIIALDHSPAAEFIANRLTRTEFIHTQHSPSRVSTTVVKRNWVTVHEYDNTLLKTFPDAEEARFVSEQRLLIASPVLEPDGKEPARRPDGCRAQSLVFWNREDDQTTEEIVVPLGGHWVLSPTRRFLVVLQPDDETTKDLAAKPEERFQYGCRSVTVRVFDTSNGQPVAEGEFPQQTVGRAAACSHDGTRLALHGGGRVLVLNMTNGTVIASGQRPVGAEKDAAFHWLAGTNYLRIGEAVVSVRDGKVITAGWLKDDAHIRVPAVCLADRYVRDSADGVLVELPETDLDALRARIDDPSDESEPITAVLDIQGIESPVLLGCVKEALRRRLGVQFVDEASPESVIIEAVYEDRVGSRQHQLDRWRDPDPVKRRQQKKSGDQEQQKEIEVELKVKSLASDGTVLDSATVRHAEAPITLDFSLPVDMQFRISSLAGALRNLRLALTAPETPTFDPTMQTALWSGESLPDASQSLDVTPTSIPVDNTWVDGAHGLPIQEP